MSTRRFAGRGDFAWRYISIGCIGV